LERNVVVPFPLLDDDKLQKEQCKSTLKKSYTIQHFTIIKKRPLCKVFCILNIYLFILTFRINRINQINREKNFKRKATITSLKK
jgi:hypothetical protein